MDLWTFKFSFKADNLGLHRRFSTVAQAVVGDHASFDFGHQVTCDHGEAFLEVKADPLDAQKLKGVLLKSFEEKNYLVAEEYHYKDDTVIVGEEMEMHKGIAWRYYL